MTCGFERGWAYSSTEPGSLAAEFSPSFWKQRNGNWRLLHPCFPWKRSGPITEFPIRSLSQDKEESLSSSFRLLAPPCKFQVPRLQSHPCNVWSPQHGTVHTRTGSHYRHPPTCKCCPSGHRRLCRCDRPGSSGDGGSPNCSHENLYEEADWH